MTAAMLARESEGKEPDPVAGRFEYDAPETPVHSTIEKRSPHRCRPSPQSLAEFGCSFRNYLGSGALLVKMVLAHFW